MIYIEVEVYEDGPDKIVFEDLCKRIEDPGYGVMGDKFKKYQTDNHEDGGNAHVTVGTSIAGPLYSSIKVTVGGSVNCRAEDIDKVHDILFEDCLEKVDVYIGPAYSALIAKLRQVKPKEMAEDG